MTMLGTFIKPMHPEGRKFVAIFAAITLVLFLIWNPLGWIGVGVSVWCYYFFRDPQRTTPSRSIPETTTGREDGRAVSLETAVRGTST